jgi:hypothetical protein
MHGYAAVEYIDMYDGEDVSDKSVAPDQIAEAEAEPDLPPSVADVPIPKGLKRLVEWFPIPGLEQNYERAKKAAKGNHVWKVTANDSQKVFANRAVELRPQHVVQVKNSLSMFRLLLLTKV